MYTATGAGGLSRSTLLGIGAGIAAGALWGLVFLAPELAPGFLPIQLSAGRYLAYGLIATILIYPAWGRLRRHLGWPAWRGLISLSLTGNIIYYLFLANAVQLGGVAMASIVIGLLPIAVTLVGSRDGNAVPLRRLLPSLLLSGAGLACIGWESLSASGPGSLAGLACAFGALVSWTIFAVHNIRWLARIEGISSHEWNLLVGVVTGVMALALAVPAFVLAPGEHTLPAWLQFGALVSAVAILCSVVGNALWNHASRALPLSLMGQMIVFETIFAALYGFLWEARWPSGFETAALGLLVAGVISCASAHRGAH
ncbi:DMT family transporter [Massilia sp. CFBP9026]|uniref:DMT family transporter n=1 Tax=Massilia sp. CFBP9026 TaxID=3096536 RepID=UPI002A6B3908|nr:DMT family transporter [Massilia sp. CFBP9026]MDY0960799.1 DMT family transporter [Massilia sp. CFBP9026]